MTVDEIKEILELMREHELAEFELQRDGETLRLRKHSPPQWTGPIAAVPATAFPPPVVSPAGAAPAPSSGDAAVLEPASEDVDLAIVKSPIVGTFYRAAEPAAPPFVDTGQTVKKGQVLCIIEAMKLMNEINAECDGEIVKVYVENGQAVQYGERLFAIRPS
jgi:acetyl-CoA carboxylase biotin carboxyl carrier protein